MSQSSFILFKLYFELIDSKLHYVILWNVVKLFRKKTNSMFFQWINKKRKTYRVYYFNSLIIFGFIDAGGILTSVIFKTHNRDQEGCTFYIAKSKRLSQKQLQ